MELNTIFNEDCLIGMKKIADKSIDMILCDLPYGTTNCKWDTIIPFDILWEQYERIIKDNGAIVLFAQTPFDKVLGASNLKLLRYEWIWEKTTATGHYNAKRMPMKAHENILVFYKKLPTYNPQKTKGHRPTNSYHKTIESQNKSGIYNAATKELSGGGATDRYPRSVLLFPSDKQKLALHPTQKPVALCEYLIRTYTNEGEVVLDNCMGSATTAVAALKTNRQYVGFEKDQKYHTIGLERVNSFLNSVNSGEGQKDM